ncbi:uncharacterized protein LOC144283545 isoform X3 [Canis aureus]
MWGRVHADRSPGLLRTRGPAVYDSGRHGATSTMTGVRLPQDPLEDPGGAVQSHIHLSRGYSERQGAPSRVSAGPVTVQGHRPPGLSAELCQETRRVDKWIKMLKRWDHYLPSEKLGWVYKGVPPQVRGEVCLRLLTRLRPGMTGNTRWGPSTPRGPSVPSPPGLTPHVSSPPGLILHVPPFFRADPLSPPLQADPPCPLPTWADPPCPLAAQG